MEKSDHPLEAVLYDWSHETVFGLEVVVDGEHVLLAGINVRLVILCIGMQFGSQFPGIFHVVNIVIFAVEDQNRR